jgi:RecG-like helicase
VPPALARQLALRPSADALRWLHAPDSKAPIDALIALQRGTSWAHQRLGFEELLAAAITLERARRNTGSARAIAFDSSVGDAAALRLGLEQTPSQREAIDSIQRAMSIDQPMRRLLVGDVGSGKTLVAAAASLAVLRGGRSVAWLVPTSIVAEQHAATLTRALGGEEAPSRCCSARRPSARARRPARRSRRGSCASWWERTRSSKRTAFRRIWGSRWWTSSIGSAWRSGSRS